MGKARAPPAAPQSRTGTAPPSASCCKYTITLFHTEPSTWNKADCVSPPDPSRRSLQSARPKAEPHRSGRWGAPERQVPLRSPGRLERRWPSSAHSGCASSCARSRCSSVLTQSPWKVPPCSPVWGATTRGVAAQGASVSFMSPLGPPGREASVNGAVVGLVELVEGEVHSVRGDGLSVQRV